MDKESQLKLTFVSLMVLLAVFGKTDPENKLVNNPVDRPEANVSNTVRPLPVVGKPISINKTANLDRQIQSAIPYRNSRNNSDPFLSVQAAFAKDLDSNFIFYKFNGGLNWPFASLTKLMSAVVAIEQVGLEKPVAVTEAAVATEGVAGNLEKDEVYRVGELAKALLVVSSNDAAAAIAEFYGFDSFVSQMQKKAAEIGMRQTTFHEPTGLSNLNQGTAEDLEKLVEYIYKSHPTIFKTSDQPEVVLFEESKGLEKKLLNINSFVHSRPEFVGGKTGFTDQAKGNLISIFKYNNRNILVIILGADDRYAQTDILYNWIKEAYIF